MSKGFDIESVEFEIPKQDMKNLVKKYKQLKYEVKKDDKIEVFEEKFGDDVIIKRKPKTIKDFLNG